MECKVGLPELPSLGVSSIDLTRMECKDYSHWRTVGYSFRIDLTRMECKDNFKEGVKKRMASIDLTRMECKDYHFRL